MFVEGDQQGGPFGAKGIGESGSFGVAPAVANAIDDAVGVRLTSLADDCRIGAARLARQAGRPLGDE